MTLSAADMALIDPDGSFRVRLMQDSYLLRQARYGNDRTTLARLVHRLAGAAATFGYDQIGDIAIGLDDAFAATGTVPGIDALLTALADIEKSG